WRCLGDGALVSFFQVFPHDVIADCLGDFVHGVPLQSSMMVERSPTGSWNSLQRRMRRTILPLRVLGSESTNSISWGMASGDSRLRIWFMISSSRSSDG